LRSSVGGWKRGLAVERGDEYSQRESGHRARTKACGTAPPQAAPECGGAENRQTQSAQLGGYPHEK
jgi:hypothetical protein